jgi:hypothetical protein
MKSGSSNTVPLDIRMMTGMTTARSRVAKNDTLCPACGTSGTERAFAARGQYQATGKDADDLLNPTCRSLL